MSRQRKFTSIANGQVIGKWTVGQVIRAGRHIYRECVCECGVVRAVRECKLGHGKSTCCGCSRLRGQGEGYKHALYNTWSCMVGRCTNPKNPAWDRYGGRGIRVCNQWLASPMAFYEYVGTRPSPEHSIDRINNDGNYEPGNVRWASPKEQSRNMRKNVVLELDGEKMVLQDWAKRIGVHSRTLAERLDRGWPIRKALTTPKIIKTTR